MIARISRYMSLLLAAFAGAAAAQAPVPTVPAPLIARPVPAPVVPPPPVRRYPLAGPQSEAWPPGRILPVRSSPDWSHESVYPEASRRNYQQGDVGMDLLVGPDGAPRACRIWQTSFHPMLDDSTCDLGMTMRFAPPFALATYHARLTWRLSDETEFGAGRLTVRLRLDGGRVSECTLSSTGRAPREWSGFACRMVSAEIAHFLNGRERAARAATIIVELIPAGEEAMPPGTGSARLSASRRTEFRLSGAGELSDCRLVRDQGFAPRTFEYSGRCGLFLSQAWLVPGRESPRAGALEINVWVEE